MWCRVCEIETTETVCSVCGYPTINDNLGSVDNTVVHYCKSCSTPIIFRLIRQIESKAFKRLRHSRRRSILNVFFEPATESIYLPESGTFIDQYYSRLLFDDFFTRIELLDTNEKGVLDQNEFSDLSQ
jgi:hypothetical protein